MCLQTPPHAESNGDSLRSFPRLRSKTTPTVSAWSNATASSRFRRWCGRFGFATGESRTLAAFRHSYNSTADEPFSPGGFYQRLTPLFAAYLRDLVEFALGEVAVPHTVSDEFDRFRDVVADATVLRLHRFLREEYQGLREEQAGAKLHLLHNVTDQTLEKISISDERTHDSTEFKC